MNNTINFTKHLRNSLISALMKIQQNTLNYKTMTKINIIASKFRV